MWMVKKIIFATLASTIASSHAVDLKCPEYGWHVNINDGTHEIKQYEDIPSWSICWILCNENSSCKYWTWLDSNSVYQGNCHLWSQMDHIDSYSTAVSGSRVCVECIHW